MGAKANRTNGVGLKLKSQQIGEGHYLALRAISWEVIVGQMLTDIVASIQPPRKWQIKPLE